MASPTPSRIARKIAGDLWPDVQAQYKVAPGTFGFSCAGHGGLVCVLEAATSHVTPETVAKVREQGGELELVAWHEYSRGRFTLKTSEKFTADSLHAWGEYPDRGVAECWIGEEDCGWALLAWESDLIRTGGMAAGYFSQGLTREDVLSSVESWNPRWLGIEPERAKLEPGEGFLRSAWGDWHEKVPAGRVGVSVDFGNPELVTYGLVPDAAYRNMERRGHNSCSKTVIDVTELEPCAAF